MKRMMKFAIVIAVALCLSVLQAQTVPVPALQIPTAGLQARISTGGDYDSTARHARFLLGGDVLVASDSNNEGTGFLGLEGSFTKHGATPAYTAGLGYSHRITKFSVGKLQGSLWGHFHVGAVAQASSISVLIQQLKGTITSVLAQQSTNFGYGLDEDFLLDFKVGSIHIQPTGGPSQSNVPGGGGFTIGLKLTTDPFAIKLGK